MGDADPVPSAVPRVHSPRDRDREQRESAPSPRDATYPLPSHPSYFTTSGIPHATRRRRSASAAARPTFAGDRTSFMSTDTYDEWEEASPGTATPVRRGQEQMSPVTVVLYVVFFYVVWQILTRSDDHEILSHLPSSSPLHSHLAPLVDQRPATPNSQPSTPYGHLAYALPQLPPPNPSEQSSTWRTVLHAIVYPIYLAVTLLAIPLPFLVNALNLLTSILSTILYPVTSTARLLARTFILAPLNVVMSFVHALFPVYVFVGGVVGVGAALGVAVGWVGRMLMWLLLGRRTSSASSTKKRKKRSSKRHSAPVAFDFDDYRHHSEREREHHPHREVAIPSAIPPIAAPGRRYVPIVDYVEIVDDGVMDARATGREPVVLGLRRRGVRV